MCLPFRPVFPFSSFLPFLFIGGFDTSALCRFRRELSNAYLLAKFRFDTAEIEPSKVCPIEPAIRIGPRARRPARDARAQRGARPVPRVAHRDPGLARRLRGPPPRARESVDYFNLFLKYIISI